MGWFLRGADPGPSAELTILRPFGYSMATFGPLNGRA
jgi:hypothetical protein